MSSTKEIIMKTKTFSTLDPDIREHLISYLDKQPHVHLKPGEALFDSTKHQKLVPFLVISGKVSFRLPGDGCLLRELHPGDLSGFLNLLRGNMSSRLQLWVGAETAACSVRLLERSSFLAVLQACPPLAFAILRHASILDYRTNVLFARDHAMGMVGNEVSVRAHDPAMKTTKPLKLLRCAVFDSNSYTQDSFERELVKMASELEAQGLAVQFVYIAHGLSVNSIVLADGCEAVCLFVNDPVPSAVAALLRKHGVKVILMRCAGFDRVDIRACDAMGISVARVPAYSPYAVAEFAVGLLLAVDRKIHKAYNKTRDGDFRLTKLVGFDLHGKTIGVLGTGKIGLCFINIMVGFGCRVLCYDVFQSPEVLKLKDKDVSYATLDQVLAESDVVSLHVPLLKETFHLINATSLAQMKKGVVIINTSRGGLVHTKDLYEALQSGHVKAAAVDVFEREADYFFKDWSEENITDTELNLLVHHPHVIVTSHQAFLTEEALSGIASTTIRNLAEWGGGKRLKELTNSLNTVSPSASTSASTPKPAL